MATATETMKNFMNVLKQYKDDTTTSGIEILDNAVRAVSRFNNLQDAINSFVKDVTDTSETSDVYQRLQNTCGIYVGKDNDFTVDTGAVSGYNAGGSTVKNAADIVPETGSLEGLSMPAAGLVTTHTYTGSDGKTFTFNVKWPESFTKVVDCKWQSLNDYNPQLWTYEELNNQVFASDNQKSEYTKYFTASQIKQSIETISKGLEHWWLDQSAKMIYNDYGLDFNGKTIKISYYVNYEVQAATGPIDKKENDTTPSNEIEMAIGMPLYGIIEPTDVNGNTRVEGGMNQNYLDRTIAHEMVHALMQSNGIIKTYGENSGRVSMPEFFTEGVAELIMGLDDFDANNTADIVSLASDRNKLVDAMSLSAGTGTHIRYTSGYMFLRYLCQQGIEDDDVLASIDEGGEDYADYLLLQAAGAYSPVQVAALKAADYIAPTSSLNMEMGNLQTADATSILSQIDGANFESLLVAPNA